jgi:TRAP-type C4-dicarboxylate transport system permease small subunit
MLETSKDLLNLVLALCIAVFTFFLCWGLYYMVMMLKKGNEALKEISHLVASIKEKIEKVEKLIDAWEEKISHSVSYVPLLFKGISELIDFFKKKKDKSKQTKKE